MAPYYCALLLAIEVFVPLIAPLVEELMAKDHVNKIEFLRYNNQFWLAPLLATPIMMVFAFVQIRQGAEVASPNEILGLNNIAQNKLTYQIWNLVCAIYGHLCLLRMLPYLCDIRKEYALALIKKLEN